MKDLQITIPDNLELTEHDVKMMVAGHLYESGKLTLGQAAELVGVSKRVFIESLGKYGFSLFSGSLDDLRSDIEHA